MAVTKERFADCKIGRPNDRSAIDH